VRIRAALLAFLCAWLVLPAVSLASVVARIDISEQRMYVYVDGSRYATWRVSTGAGRYRTPTGSFRPTVLRRMHYSSKYDGAAMPHSVFFHRGYAIHGTDQLRYLGRRASHGCVRLHPRNAARLFSLVSRHGASRTRIVVSH